MLSLPASLVAMSSRVILGTDDQTAPLLCAAVDRLDDVDQLLFVFYDPFDLVVVARSEIDHHVFVAEEKHDGALVVQLVHLVEVRNLVNVAEVAVGIVMDGLATNYP